MGADLQGDGTGSGGKALLGLLAAVDDAGLVPTYGNISRNTYTNWRANVAANGGVGRALSLGLMNNTFELASKDNTRPNLGLTTHAVYTKYMSMLQPNVRYGDTKLANMGFSNLFFQDRPLVVDENVQTAPTSRLWFLNTNYFELYAHSQRNFRFVPFQQLPDKDAIVAKILWAGQLVCSSPRLQARLDDIDTTL